MHRFNNLSLRTKMLFSNATVLTLMVGLAAIVYTSLSGTELRENEVKRSFRIISIINDMRVQLGEMQSGLRGYLITGSTRFLDNNEQRDTTYQALLQELRVLVLDAGQRERLAQIDPAVQRWKREMVVPGATLRASGGADLATATAIAAFVDNASTNTSRQAMLQALDALQQGEQALLDSRLVDSSASFNLLYTLLLAGTTLAVVLGMTTALTIATSIARRVEMVARAATAMARGHLSEQQQLPTGRDEVGTMARAFAEMADTIQRQIQAQHEANTELREASATRVAKEYLEATVQTYSAFASRVAEGDLTVRLDIRTMHDELGVLGNNLNAMVIGLQRMTGQVQQANSAMASAATEILAATSQQASAAAEQSAAITQTTTTVEEVKTIAEQTAQQATQVAQDSQGMLNIARQGSSAVEETVGGMGQIKTRVESIAQTILALSEQTQAISTIITTVNELADQSNLLALNAAIEAARAGEQGKSFAVVAQNVRALAERSKVATGQVREILGDIQRSTNAAVLVTEEGTKGVESGGRLAVQAGQVIRQIAAEVEGGAQANVQMAAAAQQQMTGMAQIGQAMTSIQQATTQSLASTRQAERAAQDLHQLAQSLQQAIAVYRL